MYSNENKPKFSLINFLKEILISHNSGKSSKKILYEYIDLKKIIYRLQDVDKLKNILLNETQKFFFDLIPKPEIVEESKNHKGSIFGVNQIVKQKLKATSQEILRNNFKKLRTSTNSVDKKIFLLLDESFQKKLNSSLEIKD